MLCVVAEHKNLRNDEGETMMMKIKRAKEGTGGMEMFCLCSCWRAWHYWKKQSEVVELAASAAISHPKASGELFSFLPYESFLLFPFIRNREREAAFVYAENEIIRCVSCFSSGVWGDLTMLLFAANGCDGRVLIARVGLVMVKELSGEGKLRIRKLWLSYKKHRSVPIKKIEVIR